MSFVIPDLVIESILRDGIENMKRRPEILDDVFADLTKAYANRKYGASEIQKIKDLLTGTNKTEIAIVHSFHEAAAKSPCISIQLGNDTEDKRLAHLDDHEGQISETITDPVELENLTKVENVIPTSYDPLSGKVQVADSVDLSKVHIKYIYQDGAGVDHALVGGLSNTIGDKFFMIAKGATVNIVDAGLIKSFITTQEIEIRGTIDDVSILIGVHTKEALLTKYLYILVKYFLKSRKHDLINRCFIASTMSGSDFTRDMRYEGDMVFTRYLTVNGKIEESWRSDQVDLIDAVELDATIIEDC